MATKSTDGLQPNNYVDSCEAARRDFFAAATYFDAALEDRTIEAPAAVREYVARLGQDSALRVLAKWRTEHADLFTLVSGTYEADAPLLSARAADRVHMGSRLALTDLRCRVFDALDLQEQHRAARRPSSNA